MIKLKSFASHARVLLLVGSALMLGAVAAQTVRAQTQMKVLHTFPTGADGEGPVGTLLRAGSNLYGTTFSGGAHGGGTVFKVDSKGKETVLNSFAGGTDGWGPKAGLIRDAAGNLYGTTQYGGGGVGAEGFGTVFKLDAAGKETVLHTFTGNPDGANPLGSLVRDSSGHETVLYDFKGLPDSGHPQGALCAPGELLRHLSVRCC